MAWCLGQSKFLWVYLFILLSARHSSRHWRYNSEQNTKPTYMLWLIDSWLLLFCLHVPIQFHVD